MFQERAQLTKVQFNIVSQNLRFGKKNRNRSTFSSGKEIGKGM
jgi:hypothetical protein